jgi:transcriptional regulator with XRE-family HTH domain
MDDVQLGRSVRALRHRRCWTQQQLGAKAGVSGGLVGLLERGRAEKLTVASVRNISHALDMRLAWDAGFRGSELQRLRDADHATLAEATARWLERRDWLCAPERSFNRYGERGRIDLLGYYPATHTLLVIEIKSQIVEIQDLLGGLDRKTRLSREVARTLGWQSSAAVPLLVVAEGSTNRRRIARHQRLFAGLALRGPAAVGWIRAPSGTPSGLLIFRTLPNRNGVDARRAGRQRIRPSAAPASVELAG